MYVCVCVIVCVCNLVCVCVCVCVSVNTCVNKSLGSMNTDMNMTASTH